MSGVVIEPGARRGRVAAPPSKSHAHRLLIANFLAGDRTCLSAVAGDSIDIAATKRCLCALAEPTVAPEFDCGESGSTLRFLAPVAAALGKIPSFVRRGRLADRPFVPYAELKSGLHELPGNVSSQFVTGLLFALPLLTGDSRIGFTTPLESRGYVDMTLSVLEKAGIVVHETENGFAIPGSQRYRPQSMTVEGDWSGAAFWLAMNALGSDIRVSGLSEDSLQPDRAITTLLATLSRLRNESTAKSQDGEIAVDVSQSPDIFPVLSVVSAAHAARTRFVGIRRLRLKECDRVAAMEDVLGRLGARTSVSEDAMVVTGIGRPFDGGLFTSCGDHRIAMSVAVAATRACAPLLLDDADCAAKSYPEFFSEFSRLSVLRAEAN